jgi:enamine deaminase RidA (YjgF/YER057c/UK114 family)
MKNIYLIITLLLTNTVAWSHEKTHEKYYNIGHMSFISSQIPINKQDELISTNIEEQVRQTFKNLVETAKEAGATIENGKIKNVIKLNVYLNDISALTIVDQYMLDYITGHLPARTPLGGIVDGDYLIAMDAIVELPK